MEHEKISQLEAALANQYQRIERFVELVDQLEAQLAALRQENEALRAQLASKDDALAAALATNQRNVEDATRIIRANDSGIHLAHISLVEWGKCNKRIAELEAQLAQTWQPLPDGDVSPFCYVDNGGKLLGVFAGNDYFDWYATGDLPDDVRLCRLVTQEPTP